MIYSGSRTINIKGRIATDMPAARQNNNKKKFGRPQHGSCTESRKIMCLLLPCSKLDLSWFRGCFQHGGLRWNGHIWLICFLHAAVFCRITSLHMCPLDYFDLRKWHLLQALLVWQHLYLGTPCHLTTSRHLYCALFCTCLKYFCFSRPFQTHRSYMCFISSLC